MKKITVIYNSAIDDEIMELLNKCGIKSYTKIENTFGSGTASGPHLGNNVWPGSNNIIMAVVTPFIKDIFIEKIKPYKAYFLKEGLKVFVENVEEVM